MYFNKLLKKIPPYAFAEIDKKVNELKNKGIEPIDFGVGDPQEETPEFIREAASEAIRKHKNSGYPSYVGSDKFRNAACEWLKRRFSVSIDPEKEICALLGSKEGIFHFPKSILNKGDQVIIPDPGYPPYKMGTLFAGGKINYVPLFEENNFYPNLEEIDSKIAKQSKIFWINYPNSPTSKVASDEFYKELIDFAHDNEIILASDEAYTEIYYDRKPKSLLEYKDAYDVSVVFQSLSKRSNMTSYRIGWVCGNEEIISTFKILKTNIDSGAPWVSQEAAAAALSDEEHVKKIRDSYREKKAIMARALTEAGLGFSDPEATFYIWQRCPEGYTSIEFAKKLLKDDVAIVAVPGEMISQHAGKNHIRIALVPEIEEINKAKERLENLDF